MRDKVAQQWCVVEGAWKICHRYAWIPFCTSIQNRQNSPSTRAGSKRPFYFFFLGPSLLLLAQIGRRGQTPPATPSAYDQYWEALCEWKLKGCPLSAGNEASPNKRNDLSLTSIFSFLLLKSDGRSHGEVRRATFDSKDSWSLPDGRMYCDKLFPPQFTLGTGHALDRLLPGPYPDNFPGIWMTQEFIHPKGQECLLLSPKHPNIHPILAGPTKSCPNLYSHNCPWKIWNWNTQWIKHEPLCFSEQWLWVSVYTNKLSCIISLDSQNCNLWRRHYLRPLSQSRNPGRKRLGNMPNGTQWVSNRAFVLCSVFQDV